VLSCEMRRAGESDVLAITETTYVNDMGRQGFEAMGIKFEPMRQGFQTMGPAVQLFTEKAVLGLLHHGDDPVLRACVNTAILVSDPSGSQKVIRQKATRARW